MINPKSLQFYGISAIILKPDKMEPLGLNSKLNMERGKLKQKLASLTDDDLLLEEGRKDERDGKYQALFFRTEEEEEEWDKILSAYHDL
jgi:uncharacterized protein YjbJ (UPF0337 family)